VPKRRDATAEDQFRLVPIRRVDVYREVLSQIDMFITENALKPGDRLPSDRDLAERLGVSRVSVRQAIKVLEGFGRLDAQRGSGTYVKEPSHVAAIADLATGLTFDRLFARQLIPVHTAIELAVLEAAFAHRTPDKLASVQAALDRRARVLAEEDDSEEGSLDFSFEAALGQICGNELLRRFQSLIQELWVRAWAAAGEAPGDKQLLFQEHLHVFERFREGDLAGALAIFRVHLDLPPHRGLGLEVNGDRHWRLSSTGEEERAT
jgi:GntR family transcriptional regulator, transcriptional repressor for pyruvate dehydrogenase complex